MNTTFGVALQVILIIISIALTAAVMLQGKGSGIGSLLGGEGGGFGISKTRRGLEKTLFQITIILAAIFLSVSILLLMVQG
jgi:preprotein translocase subunit SecG